MRKPKGNNSHKCDTINTKRLIHQKETT